MTGLFIVSEILPFVQNIDGDSICQALTRSCVGLFESRERDYGVELLFASDPDMYSS